MAVAELEPVKVRGVALRSFLETVEEVWGADVRERMLTLLEPDLRRSVEYDVLSGGWYPLAWQEALHQALQRAVGGGSLTARRLGHAGVTRDIRGPFAFLLKLLSPAMAVRQAMMVWGRYHDGGRVTVTRESPRAVRVGFEDCFGFSQNNWENVQGALTALAEATGLRHVRVHQNRVEAHSAEFRVLWVDSAESNTLDA